MSNYGATIVNIIKNSLIYAEKVTIEAFKGEKTPGLSARFSLPPFPIAYLPDTSHQTPPVVWWPCE